MRFFALALAVAACSPMTAPEQTGPVPSADFLSFTCESHGIRAYDASRLLLSDVSMTCTARFLDAQGNPVAGVKARAFTEAGRLVPLADQSDAEGTLVFRHEIAAPVPTDVPPEVFGTPIDGPTNLATPLAPAWMVPEAWLENAVALGSATRREPRRPDPLRRSPEGLVLTNNPRDNLVAMVVVVDGEESFTDANGNGTFDPGERFTDRTEPLVDADDDGTWDPGEEFVDTNQNLVWDAFDGRHQARTKIWAAERVLWTGVPNSFDLEPVAGIPGHRTTVTELGATLQLFRCASDPCARAEASNATLPMRLSDPWFNSLTHAAGDRCVIIESGLPVTISSQWLRTLAPQDVWPAAVPFDFTSSDARVGPSPRRSTPLPFLAHARCTFSNPGGTHPHEFTITAATGTIE